MPKIKTIEERREYFRSWCLTGKGFLSRKTTIVNRAIANRRCPSQHTLAKYGVEGHELEAIIEAIRTYPEKRIESE